jgi:hypothetical protein
MKKSILVTLFFFSIILIITLGSTWKNKNYDGSSFPYIGGLLCHDGDYVEFYVDPEYNGFYYMTHYNTEVNLEPYFWDSAKNKWVGLGTTLTLPSNVYPVGEPFNTSPWAWVSLQKNYVGKTIQLRLVENRTVNNHYCPSNDIIIKFKTKDQVKYWKGVDSESWCDLDQVAK